MEFITLAVILAPGLISPRTSASFKPSKACISRQEALRLAPAAAFGFAFASAFSPAPSLASGGATAGRTTSIPTAKKRYFKRVTADVAAFLQMGQSVAAGNLPGAKSAAFWAEPLEDLAGAGYLLAVAFKIDARVPPQKIQQKRDHDALIASIAQLKKAVGGSDTAAAKAQYANTLEKLDTYLKGVELPPTSDASSYQY